MLSLIISLLCGSAVAGAMLYDQSSLWGAVLTGVAVFLAMQFVIGLVLRRLITRRQEEIQAVLQEAQNRIQKQLNFYQRHPGAGGSARQELMKIQTDAARRALAKMVVFRPYYCWNFMLKRQINTMKMQLHFQLGEDRRVDELLPKCLLFDPQSIAIKLVRMYRRNDTKLDKFYRRRCSRVKGDNRACLASVYAWIKLKQEQPEAALAAILAARKVSDHPALAENYENLANRRYKHYSNSAFGDLWYALRLEEPKVKMQRQPRRKMF